MKVLALVFALAAIGLVAGAVSPVVASIDCSGCDYCADVCADLGSTGQCIECCHEHSPNCNPQAVTAICSHGGEACMD